MSILKTSIPAVPRRSVAKTGWILDIEFLWVSGPFSDGLWLDGVRKTSRGESPLKNGPAGRVASQKEGRCPE